MKSNYLASRLVKAAELAGATYVDICAQPTLISYLKSKYSIPICVSITNLNLLDDIIDAGADIIELGNFDVLYSQGFYISAQEVYNMSSQIREKYPDVALCVTIPHTLSLEDQIKLAKDLELIGVDLLQTEGKQAPKYGKTLVYNISRALSTLTTTYVLSKIVSIPIITASNLSELTCAMAIYYGASGVGVGRSIMKEKSTGLMVNKIQLLKNSLAINYSCINTVDYVIKAPTRLAIKAK